MASTLNQQNCLPSLNRRDAVLSQRNGLKRWTIHWNLLESTGFFQKDHDCYRRSSPFWRRFSVTTQNCSIFRTDYSAAIAENAKLLLTFDSRFSTRQAVPFNRRLLPRILGECTMPNNVCRSWCSECSFWCTKSQLWNPDIEFGGSRMHGYQ